MCFSFLATSFIMFTVIPVTTLFTVMPVTTLFTVMPVATLEYFSVECSAHTQLLSSSFPLKFHRSCLMCCCDLSFSFDFSFSFSVTGHS